MFSLFFKGGPVMLALLACSIWGLYLVIYQWLFLKSNSIQDSELIEKIKNQLTTLGQSQTKNNLMKGRSLPVKTLGKVIAVAHLSDSEIQSNLTRFHQSTLPKLEQKMSYLSSIITVAPILGLLGTVLGLIDIFNVISGGGIGDTNALSKGIAQALISTCAGLSISVPFIISYQLLNSKIDAFHTNLNDAIDELVQFIKKEPSLPE